MQPTETSPPFKAKHKCYNAKITEENTYNVVVLAANRALRASGGDLPTNDSDWAALEADLADYVLDVDGEGGEEGGARSRVGLGTELVSVLHIRLERWGD